MREIKFRAWNLDREEWAVYGVMDMNGNFNQEGVEYHGYRYVIQLYIGLKDKNGVEIYEGDIVRYKTLEGFDCGYDEESFDRNSKDIDIKTSVVKFSNGEFYPKEEASLRDDGYYSYRTFDFEVIGNIYENPELLEKES